MNPDPIDKHTVCLRNAPKLGTYSIYIPQYLDCLSVQPDWPQWESHLLIWQFLWHARGIIIGKSDTDSQTDVNEA